MESQLVGVEKYMLMLLRRKYFIESQCYTVKSDIMYQNNKETIFHRKIGGYVVQRAQNVSNISLSRIRPRWEI